MPNNVVGGVYSCFVMWHHLLQLSVEVEEFFQPYATTSKFGHLHVPSRRCPGQHSAGGGGRQATLGVGKLQAAWLLSMPCGSHWATVATRKDQRRRHTSYEIESLDAATDGQVRFASIAASIQQLLNSHWQQRRACHKVQHDAIELSSDNCAGTAELLARSPRPGMRGFEAIRDAQSLGNVPQNYLQDQRDRDGSGNEEHEVHSAKKKLQCKQTRVSRAARAILPEFNMTCHHKS
mmetsp:Transcript_65816/g.154959  ORF Transcript_65816/g.154959 Transcript_65816/m.154959 type:complete len:235 (+) Transcript_65816:1009-1713(+)